MSTRRTWQERLVFLAGLEAVALLMALVLPITPSKTAYVLNDAHEPSAPRVN